jgi:tetratricopeptide (TPR) repeat protein
MDLEKKIRSIHNLLQKKKFLQAKEELDKLLEKIPNNSYLLNLSGLTQQYLDDYTSAINFFMLSIKNDEKNIAAMNNLANSYKKLLNYIEAEKIYKKILVIDHNYVHALNNYANLKIEINDYNGAIELLKKAILISNQRNIKPLDIMLSLASVYQSINNLEKVKEILNEIFLIKPKLASAHKLLSEITKYTSENSKSLIHIEEMKKIIEEEDTNDQDKVTLSFAIGKSLEDLKKYEESFNYLQLANNLKKNQINSNLKDELNIIENLINNYENIQFKNTNIKPQQKKIIFICGMPRSGTTLVEQILSSHPDVYGAGELLYLEKTINNNFLVNKKINKQNIIDLQNSSSEKIISEYLSFYEIYNLNENTIVDKTPQNFKWIGFIKIFFPGAKIIICQRNPKDNCVSLFKNNFASSMMNWAYDQEEIAEYFNQYFKLINFWKKKISNDIYDLNYEKLINDDKSEIDKLLQFCNLDLNEKCYNFTKFSKTPIKTVSVSQANKPIYKDSVNSFNSYQNFLQKMFNKINII